MQTEHYKQFIKNLKKGKKINSQTKIKEKSALNKMQYSKKIKQ